MARKLVTTIHDDLTDETEATPGTFGLDGYVYEIDLTPAHWQELREVLNPFVEHGRRIGKTPRFNRPPVTKVNFSGNGSNGHGDDATPGERKAIREWYAANRDQRDLLPLSDRGRIPRSIVQAYRAALEDAGEAAEPARTFAMTVTEQIAPARKGRARIPSPPAAEVLRAWNQVGTFTGLADALGVSAVTAKKWLEEAQRELTVNA